MNNNKDKAVVLLNMGGPNNLFEVEVFLKNMFNDPLILEIKNPFIRKLVGGIITKSRLKKSQNNYKLIGGKSPIVELTFKLTQELQKLDNSRFYTYAMRYTPPFSISVAQELKNKGIKKIILFTMYPQYSKTTTLSSVRDFLKALKEINYTPQITIIENYPTDDGFLESCINKIKDTKKDFKKFILILSAHSIPQSMIDDGDIYQNEIEICASRLKEKLKDNDMFFKETVIAYQSKLGPKKWLQPETKNIIKQYKNENIMIYPIAFSIDNSETIYELDIEYRQLAKEVGVKEYIVCECPNHSITFVKAIINLINTKQKDINEAKL